MNQKTIARAIRFAMSRIVGEAGWPIAGMLGNTLAFLTLGEENSARRSYSEARRYMMIAIRKGDYISRPFSRRCPVE